MKYTTNYIDYQTIILIKKKKTGFNFVLFF